MEEHPNKNPDRLEMVSVFMGPDSATKVDAGIEIGLLGD